MDIKDCCIVTCAFREPYKTHSNVQLHTIKKELPELEVIRFIDELPYAEGIIKENIVERFQKSLYGFKPHAIQKAINRGFKYVIWFDPSVLPTSSIYDLFKELSDTDMLVRTGDNLLLKMTNDKAYKFFGVSKVQSVDVNHIGGTVYGFNFTDSKTLDVFNLWKLAEEKGVFGTQDDFMAGHWCDESCMALSMFRCGIKQKFSESFTYKNQKEI